MIVVENARISDVPSKLLLIADPSQEKIASYIETSQLFIARIGAEVVGVCVVSLLRDKVHEICNISVEDDFQNLGIGTQLMDAVLQILKEKGAERVELGTGAFGYQLTFYHKLGFRVFAVERDYFVENYVEPVYEFGVQHRDRLILYKDIK